MAASKKHIQDHLLQLVLPYAGIGLIFVNFPHYLFLIIGLPQEIRLCIEKCGTGMAAYWNQMMVLTFIESFLILALMVLSLLVVKGMKQHVRHSWKKMLGIAILNIVITTLIFWPSLSYLPKNSAGYTSYWIEVTMYVAYLVPGLTLAAILFKQRPNYTK